MSVEALAAAAVRFIGAGRAWASDPVNLSTADLILISTPERPDNATPSMIDDSRVDNRPAGRTPHKRGNPKQRARGLREMGMKIGSCHPSNL